MNTIFLIRVLYILVLLEQYNDNNIRYKNSQRTCRRWIKLRLRIHTFWDRMNME